MGELGKQVVCNQWRTTCGKARDSILVVTSSSYGNMQMKEQIAHAAKWVVFCFLSFTNFWQLHIAVCIASMYFKRVLAFFLYQKSRSSDKIMKDNATNQLP